MLGRLTLHYVAKSFALYVQDAWMTTIFFQNAVKNFLPLSLIFLTFTSCMDRRQAVRIFRCLPDLHDTSTEGNFLNLLLGWNSRG